MLGHIDLLVLPRGEEEGERNPFWRVGGIYVNDAWSCDEILHGLPSQITKCCLPPSCHMDYFLSLPPPSLDFSMIFTVSLCYPSSHVGNGNLLFIDYRPPSIPPSLSLSLFTAPGWLCQSALRWRERERVRKGGVRRREGDGRVVEHCSADKLMQQSRLSQQHTPSLAQCLHQFVHGSHARTKKKKKITPK